jgi:hypothetical protein
MFFYSSEQKRWVLGNYSDLKQKIIKGDKNKAKHLQLLTTLYEKYLCYVDRNNRQHVTGVVTEEGVKEEKLGKQIISFDLYDEPKDWKIEH